jgi:sorting nexin-4
MGNPIPLTSQSSSVGFMRNLMGGFEVLTDRVSHLMDSDPATTRRNQIAKLKDMIVNLEKQKEEAHEDLNKFGEKLLEELVRVQKNREVDVKEFIHDFVSTQTKWFEQVSQAVSFFDLIL